MNTFLLAGLIIVLLSCNSLTETDTVKVFIPGTYSAEWATEYNQTKDTLLLEPLTLNGSETFQITRRSKVEYINAAKERLPEYKISKWSGTYDAKTKTIFINNNGRVLSFDPKKDILWMGTIRYAKL